LAQARSDYGKLLKAQGLTRISAASRMEHQMLFFHVNKVD